MNLYRARIDPLPVSPIAPCLFLLSLAITGPLLLTRFVPSGTDGFVAGGDHGTFLARWTSAPVKRNTRQGELA